jgi:oligopeptide transport system permease protein
MHADVFDSFGSGAHMASFLGRRFLFFIPTFLAISLITFVLMKSVPGGPWDRDPQSKQVDPRTVKLLELQYGLNKPAWRQFVAYIIGDFDDEGAFKCGAVCGNLGPSYRQRGKTVQEILFSPPEGKTFLDSKFGYTLRLGAIAFGFAVLIGIPLGVLAALRQNSLFDYVVTFFTNIGSAVPGFVACFFAIIVFAVTLKLTNVTQDWSRAGISAFLLPGVMFGLNMMSVFARYMRTTVLEVMAQDYVRTARAKGARESAVIWRHILRNALIPVITILGPALAGLLTGSIVIEQIFGVPGVGVDFVRAIGQRDYSLIMGTTLFYFMLVILGNLSVDILYGVVDPRIRVE